LTIENKIPFILITGFLGSGKTTFIKRLLERFSDGRKIGIIQNEYASANIDTEELKGTGKKFEVLEINNGSVFCICLLANFIDSMAAFINEYHPELLILEASGLSDPIAIAEVLQHKKLDEKVYLHQAWCIIDAQNYLKSGRMIDRLTRQIRIADNLIINKTDLGKKNIPEIRNDLKSLNAYATILESTFCSVELEKELFELSLDPVAMRRKSEHSHVEPLKGADIHTVVLKTTFRITEELLLKFISEVENKLIRMKGYVHLADGKIRRIQSEFGNTETGEIHHYNGPTELIGLGYDITSAEFGRRFHEIRKNG
jgi:G3E family GTPase